MADVERQAVRREIALNQTCARQSSQRNRSYYGLEKQAAAGVGEVTLQTLGSSFNGAIIMQVFATEPVNATFPHSKSGQTRSAGPRVLISGQAPFGFVQQYVCFNCRA